MCTQNSMQKNKEHALNNADTVIEQIRIGRMFCAESQLHVYPILELYELLC